MNIHFELEENYFLKAPVDELKQRLSLTAMGSRQKPAIEYALLPVGKLTRPLLLFAAADAVGGDPMKLVPAAAGVEHCHVASLVHDDLIDEDDLRRGKPTVHKVFDKDTALVVGDALIFESFFWGTELVNNGVFPAVVVRALDAVSKAGRKLCSGQLMEATIVQEEKYVLNYYFEMIHGKTGALIELSCQLGALLSEVDDEVVRLFSRSSANFGAAFQMQDDLLPYLGNIGTTGKDPLSDISNGRPSLPLILAVSEGTNQERNFLLETQQNILLGKPIDTNSVFEILGSQKNLSRAQSLIEEKLTVAMELLEPYADTDGGKFLCNLMKSSQFRTS